MECDWCGYSDIDQIAKLHIRVEHGITIIDVSFFLPAEFYVDCSDAMLTLGYIMFAGVEKQGYKCLK